MVNVNIEGRVSFDPRTVGSKGAVSYRVGAYVGKDRATGKAQYMDFDVVDWNGVCAGKPGKGDFVNVTGRMSVGSYTDKTGAVRTTYNIAADTMQKIDDPRNNNRSSNAPAKTASSFAPVEDDTLPF